MSIVGRQSPGTDDDSHIANLEKVDHIVILMLENRSFDHMLGYLSLDGGRRDIDGLQVGFGNEYQGRRYPVHHLESTVVADDPDHTADSVDLQIGAGRMDGFVASYARTLRRENAESGEVGSVMGYYRADDVPTYDHLAREFVVCDRWFSSVPGATWPNRLYALCGRADGSRDDRPPHMPPMYDLPSFVRHLDQHGISWRWYSSDVGTLRLVDGHYSLGHHDKCRYFSKAPLNWKAVANVRVDAKDATFLEDAAAGGLPSVSWIDPSFSNFDPYGFETNDDHAPADIRNGQDLVLATYHALASGPLWDRSLLVVLYDEHGGFFDHAPPPAAADDDPETFGAYGVRVPALVVSPWVEPESVSKTVFDHTSVIKTILLRFCSGDLDRTRGRQGVLGWFEIGHPNYVGLRVARAAHLGELLTRASPRPAPARAGLIEDAAARAEVRSSKLAASTVVPPPGRPPNVLQLRMAAARRELQGHGHPTGRT